MAERDGLSADGLNAAAEDRRRRDRLKRNDAIRGWAQRKLEESGQKRAAAEAITAADPKAKAKRSASKRKLRRSKSKSKGAKAAVVAETAARSMVDQLVTVEAQAHGDYRPVDFKLHETVKDGKTKATSIRVVRNLGSSPITRWHTGGAFDERQMAAILFYQEAFRKVYGEGPRMCASYSPVIIRGAVGSIQLYAASTFAARESLRLLDQEVFFREPLDHFCVWQNVVIWEKPAGVAGAGTGFIVKRAAEARAKTIVQGMAYKIADIVIDSSRRDFGDLLLNLDAPRRPGRRTR